MVVACSGLKHKGTSGPCYHQKFTYLEKIRQKESKLQSNSVKTNSVITTPGYNKQNEPNWLVLVILRVHFLGYNEQNPVITNKIRQKLIFLAQYLE